MMVHYEALTDLRACKLLESLTSKEHVMELIEGDLAEPLTSAVSLSQICTFLRFGTG